jgi:hypothetical protein
LKTEKSICGLLAITASWTIFSAAPSSADDIIQSALLGPTGQTGGSYISGPQFSFPGQFLGVRFHLANAVIVDDVGGHLLGNGDGNIFAAIVALQSPSALPSASPFSFTPLAEVNFAPAFPSTDVLVPLSLALGPGDYALIFGSGRFGATGTANMPNNNIETGAMTYFTSEGNFWADSVPLGDRFVITTTAVPEPAHIVFLALWSALMQASHRRDGKKHLK